MTQEQGIPYQRHKPSAALREFLDPLDPGSYFDCGRARLHGLDDALLREAESRGREIGDDFFELVATDMGLIFCRPSISFAIAARWEEVMLIRPQGEDPVVLPVTWPTHGELKFTVSKRLAGNVFRRWLQLRMQAARLAKNEEAERFPTPKPTGGEDWEVVDKIDPPGAEPERSAEQKKRRRKTDDNEAPSRREVEPKRTDTNGRSSRLSRGVSHPARSAAPKRMPIPPLDPVRAKKPVSAEQATHPAKANAKAPSAEASGTGAPRADETLIDETVVETVSPEASIADETVIDESGPKMPAKAKPPAERPVTEPPAAESPAAEVAPVAASQLADKGARPNVAAKANVDVEAEVMAGPKVSERTLDRPRIDVTIAGPEDETGPPAGIDEASNGWVDSDAELGGQRARLEPGAFDRPVGPVAPSTVAISDLNPVNPVNPVEPPEPSSPFEWPTAAEEAAATIVLPGGDMVRDVEGSSGRQRVLEGDDGPALGSRSQEVIIDLRENREDLPPPPQEGEAGATSTNSKSRAFRAWQEPEVTPTSWVGSPLSLVATVVAVSTLVLAVTTAVTAVRRGAAAREVESPASPRLIDPTLEDESVGRTTIDHQRFNPNASTTSTDLSPVITPEIEPASPTTAGAEQQAAEPEVQTRPRLCNSNYSGCVADVSDVDCPGDGDGPVFSEEPAIVMGQDIYELDTDGDGETCEADQPKRSVADVEPLLDLTPPSGNPEASLIPEG